MKACFANEKKWLLTPNKGIFDFNRSFWSIFIVWKRKFDFMSSFWFFNEFYFFQCAFTRLCETGSRACAKAIDEFFFTLQKNLLFIIFFFLNSAIFGFFCDTIRISACIFFNAINSEHINHACTCFI